MGEKMACNVRLMDVAEMEIAAYLAYREGWNPGLADGWAFYQADPNGFFIAEIDGKVVGCISAVKYSAEFGFIGFYVVEPEHRGTVAGTQLAITALNYLAGCNIGIDGVPDRIANYERLGFKAAHFNARYENVGADYKIHSNIVFLNTVNRELLYDYDRTCFPALRKDFIDAWVKMPNTKSYIYLEDSKVKGWGLIRKCRKGYKIGPLFADNYEIADNLYRALAKNAIDELIYLDIPLSNQGSQRLVDNYGMNKVFETSRMYSINEPDIEKSKIYGITSFELG
jgi:GNAT superfamily N-acetyltransferase